MFYSYNNSGMMCDCVNNVYRSEKIKMYALSVPIQINIYYIKKKN